MIHLQIAHINCPHLKDETGNDFIVVVAEAGTDRFMTMELECKHCATRILLDFQQKTEEDLDG